MLNRKETVELLAFIILRFDPFRDSHYFRVHIFLINGIVFPSSLITELKFHKYFLLWQR